MVRKTVLPAFLLFAALVYSSAFSQETPALPEEKKEQLVLQRISGPVTLDGFSDEEAWKGIKPLPMVMHLPNFGNPPTEETVALIGFDDEYLYVAGRLYDKEPSKIMAMSKKRDYLEGNTEWFGLIIDTFNDKENGMVFFTTPTGLRLDAMLFNDAEGQLPINISWNTFWDVAAVQNDQGWFTEMRIPLSSLRFQEQDGYVTMGLIIWRYIARKFEIVIFPPVPPKWGGWSAWKVSRAHEIILEGVQCPRPIYITPYGLGGYGQAFDLNEEETAYERTRKPTYEAGLDIKYGISSNLTLDVTVNPDFAQVEADDQQVNLTRFSLFFPEKRLFFQERSSTFDFTFGEPNTLFYSRRIGIYELEDDGEWEMVRIYGGARLVGRVGAWDLGFLDMQTAPLKKEGLSSENFGVFRLRRRIFNPYSYIGGIITSRLGTDGSYNSAYGLDGIFRVSEDDYLLFNWAQTFENDKENNPVSLDPARLRMAWERRTLKGLGFNLEYSRAGSEYSPGIGFETREDFSRLGNRIWMGWLPGEESFLSGHQVFLDGFIILRNEDSSVESAEVGPGWGFLTKSGYGGEFSLKMYHESVLESFSFLDDDDDDDVEVLPGEYTFYGLKGSLETPMGRPICLRMNIDGGSFYDGWKATVGVSPIWGISPELSLTGIYEFNHVEFPDRNQKFIAHITRLRLLATLSTKLSASAFVQYNSAIDALIANFRIRYNPREGVDLYVVYNENLNTNRSGKYPIPPFSGGRTIMLKYSYTFVY
ncbi:MAG: DUF5916 domain-containing protein [Candidatus Aminicenantaceae bacterium]